MEFKKWKKYVFSEAVEINPKEKLSKSKMYKKIGMADVEENNKYVKSYSYHKFTTGSKFRQGDTLFSRITPCLENGKISKVDLLKDNELGFGSTEFIVFRSKPGITDNDYIYYLSIWDKIKDIAIKSMTGTSGRQRVQYAVFNNILIDLPSIEEQKKISRVLSLLDEKIKNNNKIILNLETQAQSIFKSWFVDFEPFENGEFIKSELGTIPEGWEIKTLKDFFPVVTGKKNANIATEDGKYPFFTCSQNISYTDSYSFDSNSILLAGNELTPKSWT